MRMTRNEGVWTLTLFMSLLRVALQPAAQSCPQAVNSATAMGERWDSGEDFPAGDGTFEVRHDPPPRPGGLTGASIRYMRVRLRVTAPADLAWQIVVRDDAGHAIDMMTAADFRGSTERWTSRVPGNVVRFDRYADTRRDEVGVHFVEYIAMASDAVAPYYSYQNPQNPQIYPLYVGPSPAQLDDKRLGDSVAFLMAAFGRTVWTCSGVVVGRDLLMTNWHCGGTTTMAPRDFWQDAVCKSALIDLSWDDDGRSREFVCSEVVDSDDRLDIAILRIRPIEGGGSVRPATLSNHPPAAGPVRLIHHPEARQKRISLSCVINNTTVDGWRGTPGIRFTHKCDSEGGSSGAPVFNGAGEVVGLHHHGFERNPQTCAVLGDKDNKAIRMDAIIRWLMEPARSALLTGMDIK